MYGTACNLISRNFLFSMFQDKIDFCQDYLNAMNIIDPGLSHNRGRTLWELYSVQAFILGQKWQNQTISKNDFKKSLKELIAMLEDTKNCLEHCPSESFENKVYKWSTKALINTKDTLTFLDLNL